MFLYGFTVGCLAIILAEVVGVLVYVNKRGGKK